MVGLPATRKYFMVQFLTAHRSNTIGNTASADGSLVCRELSRLVGQWRVDLNLTCLTEAPHLMP